LNKGAVEREVDLQVRNDAKNRLRPTPNGAYAFDRGLDAYTYAEMEIRAEVIDEKFGVMARPPTGLIPNGTVYALGPNGYVYDMIAVAAGATVLVRRQYTPPPGTNTNSQAGLALDSTPPPAAPQHALDTLNIVRTTGRPPAGYQGGRNFENDGRLGGQVLPRTTSNGAAITYAEYDVNPLTPGVRRGTQRLVIGSDGRAYYTSDHYATFTEIP
jgi:guanyl-specific ribonuclease Sa